MSKGSDQKSQSRRRLLKHLAAGGGGLGAVAALPDRWIKPVVDSVIVPLLAQTSPAIVNPIALAGSWSGSWNDTIQAAGGTATMTVAVDANARTFVIVLDLNGPVLARQDTAPPQTLTGTFTTTGGRIGGTQVVPIFGLPSITISPTGTITGSFAPLPENGTLQFTGIINATTLVINYTAQTAIPSPRTFAGTLTLTK
jgi:hypothetical protein